MLHTIAPDNHRYLRAVLIHEALCPKLRPAVVSNEYHYRIVQQPLLFKLVHDHPELRVHILHLVKIAGELLTHLRMVSKIRRKHYRRRIDRMLRLGPDGLPPVATVRIIKRNLREEGSIFRHYVI